MTGVAGTSGRARLATGTVGGAFLTTTDGGACTGAVLWATGAADSVVRTRGEIAMSAATAIPTTAPAARTIPPPRASIRLRRWRAAMRASCRQWRHTVIPARFPCGQVAL